MDTLTYKHNDGQLPIATVGRRDENGKLTNCATLWFDGTNWNRVHDYYQSSWATVEEAFAAARANFDREAEILARRTRSN